MFKTMKKWWHYLGAKFNRNFEQRADPAVQLEQALAEAQQQDRRLREQAANAIAGQKQSEMRLNAKLNELAKLNANARQALVMAADARRAGETGKPTQYTSAAETIATQLIQVEKDVEGLKQMVLDSTHAADQAQAAVDQRGRSAQARGRPERPAAAAEARRQEPAPVPARPGEDAGRAQCRDGSAE